MIQGGDFTKGDGETPARARELATDWLILWLRNRWKVEYGMTLLKNFADTDIR